jgi:hypothetical protein
MKRILFTAAFLLLSSPPWACSQTTKMSFWEDQRRGANLFNSVESFDRLHAAKEFGVQFVRLAPNKWLNGRPASRVGDFLMGPADGFKALNHKDLELLKQVLDDADKVGLKVVLTMLSLPGSRWQQHNNGVEDRRIWQDFEQQALAISFWKQLAAALRGHAALVGYNIRNEPTPEFVEPKLSDWYTEDYEAWYQKVKGTPADLNLFYWKVIEAIREEDAETPIVLDSGFYATPWAFKVLAPVADKNVLYSFHMYEPYSYNSRLNAGRFRYPGRAPVGGGDQAKAPFWDKDQLEEFLDPISAWQVKHEIPSNRILVGEFGVFRTNAGAEDYLRDVIQVMNTKGWHWAFYSFREDTWPGMDYELGTETPDSRYWEAIEKKQLPGPKVYKPNALSALLQAALKGRVVTPNYN